jgi:hypothetical protein
MRALFLVIIISFQASLCFAQSQKTMEFVELFCQKHQDQFGYSVQTKSVLNGNELPEYTYNLFGHKGAVFQQMDGGLEQFSCDEYIIRIDNNTKTLIVESTETMGQDFNWWTSGKADTIAYNFEVLDKDELVQLTIKNKMSGDQQLLLIDAKSMEIKSMSMTMKMDGLGELELESNFSSTEQIPHDRLKKNYIRITDNKIFPLTQYANYEVLNVLF